MYFAGAIIDEKTSESLEYRELIKRQKSRDTWFRSLATEMERLTQGIRDIKRTDTIFFVPKHEIAKVRLKEVTYARIVHSGLQTSQVRKEQVRPEAT